MLPYVIIHIGLSVDGRIDWGGGSDNPYYDLVREFHSDTDISSSNTMLTAFLPEDPQKAFGQTYDQWIQIPDRPRLAVIDSRGRIKTWHLIKKQPWWRDYISLCSEATPGEHLRYLEGEQVKTIVIGKEHVDLRVGLETLGDRYEARRVRLDCGGILNGVFLREGLVDEVSLVISPALVGGTSPKTMFNAPDLTSEGGVIPLTLIQIEKVKDRYLWVRYRVNAKSELVNESRSVSDGQQQRG